MILFRRKKIIIKSICRIFNLFFGLALFIFSYVIMENPVAYGEYPPGVNELAYFAQYGGWGDPNNQHRFAAIRILIYDGKYQTKHETYASFNKLIKAEDLAQYEGVAVECRECDEDIQKDFTKVLNKNGVENILFWPSGPKSEWSKTRQIFLKHTTGKVTGKIIAVESGEPLQGAFVSTGYIGDDANEYGEYEIDTLAPGLVRLVASRRDRKPVETEINVILGETIHKNFYLPVARPACCKLEGEWEIILTLTDDKRPPKFKPEKVRDTASGRIVFSKKYKDPLDNRYYAYPDSILDEYGEYDIDLTPFFGENITKSMSNSIFPGHNEPDPLKQVHGTISHHDKVNINFIPRMSHGGISLDGIIIDDTKITGKWHKRDFALMVWGTFTMKRVGAP